MRTAKTMTRTASQQGRRPNKYHARRVSVDGEKFDSQAEYERWRELRLLERAGEISNLERQVKIPLEIGGRPIKVRSKGYPNGRPVKYWADFVYFENGQRVYEDKKGFDTPISRLKRAVVEAMYPGVEVRVT